ncbi:hypothetical protein [Orenia marismortui]|nr:hypothetical protein [Orenia marismortui]
MRAYLIEKHLSNIDSKEIIEVLKNREDVEVIDCGEEIIIKPLEEDE